MKEKYNNMIKKKSEKIITEIEDVLFRENFESMTPVYRTNLMPKEILVRRVYIINSSGGPKCDLDDCIMTRHKLLMKINNEYIKMYAEFSVKIKKLFV